jgi:hypothetical protein
VPAGGLDAADVAGAAVEIEWQELDPELPYNKDRAGVMQQGQLRCYQLGSATLGRTMNEDDAEKGEHGSTPVAGWAFRAALACMSSWQQDSCDMASLQTRRCHDVGSAVGQTAQVL